MIATSKITMRFGKTALFEDVSVKFTPGNRYGLIGANGSGKSTFMKILTGQQDQSEGDVAIGHGCTLGYLRQDHSDFDEHTIIDTVYMGNPALWKLHCEREYLYSKDELTDEESDRCGHIEEEFGDAGGYTMEAEAATLLVGLGFTEDLFEQNMTVLQGGFKLRVLLAQVLFGQPDILLLDEPTNHLDMESIEWLVELLKRYTGTLITISHDRFFLNQVCTHIADLDYHEIRMFPGNYDDFTIASLDARELQEKANKKVEKQAHDLKAFISRFSSNASKAKQATSRKKTLDKLEMTKFKPSSRVSPFIRFAPKTRLGNKVIEASSVSKSYDEELFSGFSCTIGPEERVAIIGKNGIGKTTLLNILCNQLKSDAGEIEFGETVEVGMFPQDAASILDPEVSALDWLSRFAETGTSEVELRSFMGRMLFRGDDCWKKVGVLSGGEKARLIISKITMEGGNVLALDEPTNHLDLESIEALNFGLSLFPNTLLFVSHDHRFIATLATRILEVTEEGIVDYPGTLDEYEALKKSKKGKG
ncbi:ABC-F family ATP-binding cassette domain-containing protein [Pontiella sulfatireligans]|uniref:Probable ATP-binding protein YbiT n=1 Tax=Pontiella sulfatireligans TaxID=2750658 RepID=A0A6C2UGN9_9BACT|nr:ATP-binding cassette domain-containing protein [Pontiella sulfatireligans]VGO19023.1 putative ABC transporter ATP-binding protein YbiT [Pontiella sulfatireligans]